ncbi:MFS transporter [Stygiolobus caldivivus]|uniref:MFS transporter n=1 Tax=Stygiolobus caldivivus TaxID=2824673 RepID=A0A8D5ZIY9_9CREN|nr:MFS transporter [Stygiolobus caldivivus]BCU69692.1 MFS transporter [Stygiolobus caldivivus]
MKRPLPIIPALIIIAITFSLRASNNMLITTVPLIAEYYFHFPSILIGIISSLAAIFSFISSGFLNSRLKSTKRRKAFIISSVAYAVTFPLFFFADSLNIWFLAPVLGFAMGLLMPNIMTYASLFKDQRLRERMLSLYTLALSTSLIIGPLIESAILLRFSLFQAFLPFSVFAILVAIISPLIKFPQEGTEKEDGRVRVWEKDEFKLSVSLNLMYGIPFGMLTTFGGIYAVEQFKASYSLATALFGVFFATSFLGRLILTISPPKNIWAPVWISTSLTLTGLLMVFLAPNLSVYILALIVLGIPHGLTYPVSLISLSRGFPVEERSVANSYFSAIMMGFSSFIPIIISSVVNFFGIRNSFAILTVISLGFSLFILRIFLRERVM